MPHAIELLEYLKNNGYRIWLTTNADCAGLDFKLAHTGLAKYFEVIVSSENIGYAKERVEFWKHCNNNMHLILQIAIL